ncbi:MAG: OsmC family protein [Planctomycetota bacterium]
MAAINACMSATFVTLATRQGVELKSLEIHSQGDIDLRGFLRIDPNVAPGYEQMRFTFRVESDADTDQLEQIHQTVRKLSPNYFNMATVIQLQSELVTG